MESMGSTEVIHREEIQVRTFECDFNHRWKPASFFQRLTDAAGRHATALGWGYEAMKAQDLFWVLSRMKIKFLRFPNGGEVITIRTWPKTIQQKLFYIRDFEILDSNGAALALATSAWLVVNAATRRMVPPQANLLTLPSRPDKFGLDEPLEKISLDGNGVERLSVHATYSMVDVLGHVNNSRYAEWTCDTFPLEEYNRHMLDWMQINYDHEVQPGEQVAVLSSSDTADPDLWTVEGVNRSNGTRAFEAALRWRHEPV